LKQYTLTHIYCSLHTCVKPIYHNSHTRLSQIHVIVSLGFHFLRGNVNLLTTLSSKLKPAVLSYRESQVFLLCHPAVRGSVLFNRILNTLPRRTAGIMKWRVGFNCLFPSTPHLLSFWNRKILGPYFGRFGWYKRGTCHEVMT
jgi:hypothetical protein